MKGLFFFKSVGVPGGSPELGKGNSGWVPSFLYLMVTEDPLFRHNFFPLISLPSEWTLSAHRANEMLWLKFEPFDQAVYSLPLALEDVMVLPVKVLKEQEVE